MAKSEQKETRQADNKKQQQQKKQEQQQKKSSSTSFYLVAAVVACIAVGTYLNGSQDEAELARSTRSLARVPTCTKKPESCGYGVLNSDSCECECFASNANQVGYCLNSDDRCWVVKSYNTTTNKFFCPAGSKPSSRDAFGKVDQPADPKAVAPTEGCLFGTLKDNQCQCINSKDERLPGYCLDAKGRCTVFKVWDGSKFVCPKDSVPSDSGKPLPPPPSPPSSDKGPANGCGFGSWDANTKSCACIRADNDKEVGFCLDDNGRCTIVKEWTGSKFQCPNGKKQSPSSADCPPIVGNIEPNLGCVYGSWNASTGSCNCIRSGSTKEVGFCLDGNGRCTISSVPDANNRFSCPPGSKPSFPSQTCVAPTVNPVPADVDPKDAGIPVGGCVWGSFDAKTKKCRCINENNAKETGYCLDSAGKCTVFKLPVLTAQGYIFTCPTGSCESGTTVQLPTSTDPVVVGCGYGTLVDGKCRCFNSNDNLQPGYCLDSSRRCTVVKSFDSGTQRFACPANSTASDKPDPTPPAPNVAAKDCVFGTLGTNGICQCIREGSTNEVGFCKDSNGRCTIVSVPNANNVFSCPNVAPKKDENTCPEERFCDNGKPTFSTTGCVNGDFVGCKCECKDGWCKDASGVCTIKEDTYGQCPNIALPSGQCPKAQPNGGCGNGLWDAKTCTCLCVGEGSDKADGWCRNESTGKCSNKKIPVGTTGTFTCPKEAAKQEDPSAGQTTVASGFSTMLVVVFAYFLVMMA